jgi:hypothetical protein
MILIVMASLHPNRRSPALLISMLLALVLGGCGDSAKPVPVKDNHAPPPYAGHGMDAVGVGRDPSHHSPFGSATDTTGEPGRLQTPPPTDRSSDRGQ